MSNYVHDAESEFEVFQASEGCDDEDLHFVTAQEWDAVKKALNVQKRTEEGRAFASFFKVLQAKLEEAVDQQAAGVHKTLDFEQSIDATLAELNADLQAAGTERHNRANQYLYDLRDFGAAMLNSLDRLSSMSAGELKDYLANPTMPRKVADLSPIPGQQTVSKRRVRKALQIEDIVQHDLKEALSGAARVMKTEGE